VRGALRRGRHAPSRWRGSRGSVVSSRRSGRNRPWFSRSGIGGTNWSPMSYNPETGFLYVPGTVRTSAFARYGDTYKKGKQYNGGTQAAPIGSAMSGNWTAITSTTNKIAWRKDVPYRVGSGGGSSTTAGGPVFPGDSTGTILA